MRTEPVQSQAPQELESSIKGSNGYDTPVCSSQDPGTENDCKHGLDNELVTKQVHDFELYRWKMKRGIQSSDQTKDLIHRDGRNPLSAKNNRNDCRGRSGGTRTKKHNNRHQLHFTILEDVSTLDPTVLCRTINCRMKNSSQSHRNVIARLGTQGKAAIINSE